jgi:hypothetical protein
VSLSAFASGRVAGHATLEQLRKSWADVVRQVEAGYAESVYEYGNEPRTAAADDRRHL